MENKQWQIYLRRKPGHPIEERVPVTEEFFHEYYRDIDAYRRKQQRHGKCSCPKERQLWCDMDCETCPYRECGDTYSLNTPVRTDIEDSFEYIDILEDPSTLLSEAVTDGMVFGDVLKRIAELMPEALEIGHLREQGITDSAIAEKLGVLRQTFCKRIERLRQNINNEFNENF